MIKFDTKLINELKRNVEIDNTVVIYGNTGKTVFINHLFPELIVYDSREITDPKSLGGFYSIVENDLKYIEGILVNAMENGKYVCFKNIQYNQNLLQYLMPVISERILVTNSNKFVKAHSNFRLFLTSDDIFEIRNVKFIGPIRFKISEIAIPKPAIEVLEFISSKISNSCLADKGIDCNGICLKTVEGCDFNQNENNYSQIICKQEFLCSTHFKMISRFLNLIKNLEQNSSENRFLLYQSIVNIYLKHENLEIFEYLYLKKLDLILPDCTLAKTTPVETTINSLILNIKNSIPTLLVGETGSGKTALIQYLSIHSEYFFGMKSNLKIVNISSDFDGTDLIGGYQSVNFDQKIKEIFKVFDQISGIKNSIPTNFSKNKILEELENELNKFLINADNNKKEEINKLKIEIYKTKKLLSNKIPFIYKEGILTEAMRKGNWILLDEINLAPENTLDLIESVLSKKSILLAETNQLIEVHPSFRVFACMNPFGDFGKKKFNTQIFNNIVFNDISLKLEDIEQVVAIVSRNLIPFTNEISKFFFELKKGIQTQKYTNFIEPVISGRTLVRAINLIKKLILVERKLNKNSLEAEKLAISKAFNLLFFTQLDLHSRSLALSLFKNIFNFSCFSENNYQLNSDKFILTDKIRILLNDVILAIEANFPLLLQGDTSTGKTSMILAIGENLNKKVIRINNHQHTESSDYIGRYINKDGLFVFEYGPLVKAMINGDWVILDELNLAPSDVLEVLNRVLDDNKEIYISETDEIIKCHEKFRLFATQNCNYSGRNGLAKSFRNRFVEIIFYEKGENEIKEILQKTTNLPESFINLMISVYKKLKFESNVHNLMTLRDLFKWAKRSPEGYFSLFKIGLNIILERQRLEQQKEIVFKIFVDVFYDKIKLDLKNLSINTNINISNDLSNINNYELIYNIYLKSFEDCEIISDQNNMIFTNSFKKLFYLMKTAWENNEPVLLIGETGIGKTKICEIVSSFFNSKLSTINMNSNIECSDFIGHFELEKGIIKWIDGILIKAMTENNSFLIDEINLAEDSVLERLNSLLENDRSIFVTEVNKEYKNKDFKIVATMNPSGDFGKRELSPALRNRFTEIYFEIPRNEKISIFSSFLLKSGINDLFYQKKIEEILDLSIRKMELLSEHILRLSNNLNENLLVKINFEGLNKEEIWKDCLELISTNIKNINNTNIIKTNINNNTNLFYPTKNLINFQFSTKTSNKNLKNLLRGFLLNKGILLQGEPGTGKTSIITALAKNYNKKCLRINLSENTEMSDLLGSFLPIGNSIQFIPSEFIDFIENGNWIILDEINLCTQSIIEGLNSILDYRKSITLNGKNIKMNSETKIFGTMNPSTSISGRKNLPKSFLDRFICVEFEEYDSEDIQSILKYKFGNNYIFNKEESLRGNMKLNQMNINNTNLMNINNNTNLMNINNTNLSKNDKINYSFNNNLFVLDNLLINYQNFDKNFVLIHSQIEQIKNIIKCILNSVPIILVGNIGRYPIVKFISQIFNLELNNIYCHANTDITDLLGQYHKNDLEDGSMFCWKNSQFVNALLKNSLILINSPELVEKSIFDRLNSIFESERFINIYEKGIDTQIEVNKNVRFILACENENLLSPALLDRCCIIKLNNELTEIDLLKMFNNYNLINIDNNNLININNNIKYIDTVGNHLLLELENRKSNLIENFDKLINNQNIIIEDLGYDLKVYNKLNILPNYIIKNSLIPNLHNENDIKEYFKIPKREIIEFDESILELYKYIKSFSRPAKICKNFISIIKTIDFEDFVSCKEKINLRAYKEMFIKDIKNKKIKDLSEIIKKKNLLLKCEEIEIPNIFINENIISNKINLNNFIQNKFKIDPIFIYKINMENELIKKENNIIEQIEEQLINIYKYNSKNNISELINKIHILRDEFNLEVSKMNLNRDWNTFINNYSSITFCDYINNSIIKEKLEEFSDIFDFILIYLFNNKCHKCNNSTNTLTNNGFYGQFVYKYYKNITNTYKISVLKLIRNGEIENIVTNEYSKYLYKKLLNLKSQASDLIFDCLVSPIETDEFTNINNLNNNELLKNNNFTNEELDLILTNLVPLNTSVQIIESRESKIILGKDILNQNISLISECSIFSTPEYLINYLSEISLIDNNLEINDLTQFLTNFYKKNNCLNIDKNYKYFMYFLFEEFNKELLERYFLESTVYEFLDRIYFAEKFLSFVKINYKKISNIFNLSDNSIFYEKYRILSNSVLLYKSFDIENEYIKLVRKTKTKLFKEPRMYENTISLFVDKFLLIPVTSIMSIQFDIPKCDCEMKSMDIINTNNNSMDIININNNSIDINNLFTNFDKKICICKNFINLSNNINKNIIYNKISVEYSKKELLNNFYLLKMPFEDKNPIREIIYNNNYINLAKTLNEYAKNQQSEEDDKIILLFFKYALENIDKNFISSFLYFVYKYIKQIPEQIEDGTGLKSGEGENNITDEIDENDIQDDVDKNKNDLEKDSEAQEIENDGEFYSAEQEDKENDLESGVDDKNEEGEESSVDENERGEENKKDEIIEDDGVKEDSEAEETVEDEVNEFDEDINESMCEEEKENNEISENDEVNDNDDIRENNDISESDECNESEEINLNTNNYQFEEAKLNNYQTCEIADNYDSKVQGENAEAMDALQEGEGEEAVAGEDENNSETLAKRFKRVLKIEDVDLSCTKLTNLLRVILESNKNSKYRGNYKSGKKLNMKAIVPYIASDYTKDKIWMKRRKADKSNYILRLFIDNSKSMADQKLINLLSEIYHKIKKSFSALNIPVEVYKFGNKLIKINDGEKTLSTQFDFDDSNTLLDWVDDFKDGLNVILTDGIFTHSRKENFLAVMIDKKNIKSMSKVSLIQNKVFIEKYLDTFAMKYCIVEDIEELEVKFVEALSELIKTNYN